MNTIVNIAEQFADAGVSIGGKLITFMTASGHEIALIGVGAFVLVTAVGLITRFFKN